MDGVVFMFDENTSKLTIRVRYKDFSEATARATNYSPFGTITMGHAK
jgi:hypothetical protein